MMQMEAIKAVLAAALSELSRAELVALTMEPYEELRGS